MHKSGNVVTISKIVVDYMTKIFSFYNIKLIIEIDTMNIFYILGFAVNNHTIGLIGIISNI